MGSKRGAGGQGLQMPEPIAAKTDPQADRGLTEYTGARSRPVHPVDTAVDLSQNGYGM